MKYTLITALIGLFAVVVMIVGLIVKSEMDLLDQNGDPIEEDEQR